MKNNLYELFKQRLDNSELYYDDNWITDGNIIIKRNKRTTNLENLLVKAIKRDAISKLIKLKGEYIGNFDLKNEYKNCIYNIHLDSSIIPVDVEKKWYLDSRWLNKAVKWVYDIEEIKVYEWLVDKGNIGCILELTGWIDDIDYFTGGGEAEPIIYIMGILENGGTKR